MLGHSTILKLCVHEEYHLVFILDYCLVSMWYNSHEKFNFIMSINYLFLYLFASCWFYGSITLWGSHMLSAYYNPRKCEYSRLCHLELILIII